MRAALRAARLTRCRRRHRGLPSARPPPLHAPAPPTPPPRPPRPEAAPLPSAAPPSQLELAAAAGEALRQAMKAWDAEEVPVGAVIVHEGRILARGFNQVEMLNDATAHAEMLALTAAAPLAGGSGCPSLSAGGVTPL